MLGRSTTPAFAQGMAARPRSLGGNVANLGEVTQGASIYDSDAEVAQEDRSYDHPLNLLAELHQLMAHIEHRHEELEKRARDLARRMHNTREMQDNVIEQIIGLSQQHEHHRFQTETQGKVASISVPTTGGY